MRHIIICGGRLYNDRLHLERVCQRLRGPNKNDLTLIIGISEDKYLKAKRNKSLYGTDFLAYDWAKRMRIPVVGFAAQWDDFGKAAGPIRNKEMAAYAAVFLPDAGCIAFWDGQSPGTANMIQQAGLAGIPVHIEYYK